MSMTLTFPEGFQYVGAALLSTPFLLLHQSIIVSRTRKRAGIKYPQMYAEKAEAEGSRDALLFNCAQRAHQNTLELIPQLYLTALISGTKFPITTAIAVVYWTISRLAYTRGYLTGDPEKRVSPLYTLGVIDSTGLLLLSTYVAGGWVFTGLKAYFKL